ncbi:MAG TPA: LamG domain-containing protein, partial [Gemmataceae bacterium]|nr:LamG domain-containing protein [Gemmataceae bacterium]
MTRRWARLACAGLCVAAVVGVALYRNTPAGAGTQPDLKPTAHWVFDADGMTGNKVADRCGRLPATVIGSPKLIAATPTPRLEFAGPDDGVVVQEKVTPDAEFLPKQALSVVAWVRIDEGTEWGGILGCFQDNGPAESGFILGYNKTSFYFCLATKGAARAPTREIAERPSAEGAERGDGKLTYLAGKTPFQKGKWYHVAGVYDGEQMRLYVNGQLDGTSDEQKGPVLYAKSAPMVIGRYRDDDEDFPMRGAIREVMLCPHAVGAEQLTAHFEADRGLAEAGPDDPPGPRFLVEPYLQYATRTGMTVMWETEQP